MNEETKERYNVRIFKATTDEQLKALEKTYRKTTGYFEQIPFARNTPFVEIAHLGIEDKNGDWSAPVCYILTTHEPQIGAKELCRKAEAWYMKNGKDRSIDILSVTAGMDESKLSLRVLVRVYNEFPPIEQFFADIGDEIKVKEEVKGPVTGQLIIPDLGPAITEEDRMKHSLAYNEQQKLYYSATEEKPFLNQIQSYIPRKIYDPLEYTDLIYDLQTKDASLKLHSTLEQFQTIFADIMNYVSGSEYFTYMTVIGREGDMTEADFLDYIKQYIQNKYVITKKFAPEDMPTLMERINNALFRMYVLQDLIDDPMITDIKVTGYDEIRVRVKGKAYLSNVHFVNEKDMLRFITALCYRNHINQDCPSQTFTEKRDDGYVLRLSLYAEYVNSVDWPYLHIRKISRKKMLGDDLIKAKMLTPVVRDYLLDCARNSRGVIFAGPPGSGKTVALNWFLEEGYERSAEILVIQENDELFSNRPGVMFQHVVNYSFHGVQAVSLEDLGKLALVAGANVFVIGEVKGAEICSAVTLSNSGCRTAMTIHSNSSEETIDKMADLCMRGYAQDYDQAKRMLKSFQTIVYLEDFSVKEISEIVGYDEVKKDMIYRPIYRKAC